MDNTGLEHLPAFITSLAIGLLIGMERERNPAAKAGLRTFAVVALLGTLLGMLSTAMDAPWLVAAGLVLVGILIVAAYVNAPTPEGDPGTTTEAALIVCYCLGVAVWFGYGTLAIIIGVVTTVLLYFKPELSGISKGMKRSDLLSILQFAVLSFVILPILPNRDFGPYNALNPHHIWLMVVLISGVSLAGYVALRFFGQRWGTPLLGIFGGLVSSTATTLVYARHGRESGEFMPLTVLVILLANLVLMVRLAILGAIMAPEVLPRLLPMLGAGLSFGMVVTAYWWRKLAAGAALPAPEIKNPTEIRAALTFGALYAVVLFMTVMLSDYFGSRGLYAVALASGLTDVDSITLSSLRLLAQNKLLAQQVVTAVGLAVIANIVFKIGLVLFVGGAGLAWRCASGMVAVAAGIGLALWLF